MIHNIYKGLSSHEAVSKWVRLYAATYTRKPLDLKSF